MRPVDLLCLLACLVTFITWLERERARERERELGRSFGHSSRCHMMLFTMKRTGTTVAARHHQPHNQKHRFSKNLLSTKRLVPLYIFVGDSTAVIVIAENAWGS